MLGFKRNMGWKETKSRGDDMEESGFSFAKENERTQSWYIRNFVDSDAKA
jgi:hypothetical protein